jgi:FkbM family methyltransferase
MSNVVLRLAALTARVLPMSVKQAMYRWPPLAKAARGILNRASPKGIHGATIAGGQLAGLKFLLNMQTEKDLWLGTFEPELQRAVEAFVRPGMIAYDVGANIGYVTLMLAQAVGSQGRVLAFEPLPQNLERLKTNLELNSVTDRVSVIRAAVGDRSGQTQFSVHESTGMGKVVGSAGRVEQYLETIEVDLIDLDTFVFDKGHPAPDLIKVDIEGGEVLALPGMMRVLTTNRPLLFLELHGDEAAKIAWETLTRAGYRAHSMQPGYPAVESLSNLTWKAYIVGLPGEFRSVSDAWVEDR